MIIRLTASHPYKEPDIQILSTFVLIFKLKYRNSKQTILYAIDFLSPETVLSPGRALKVYPKYFDRVNTRPPVIFPEIRLCGKWLKDIGFDHDQMIKVRQEKHKIIITIEENRRDGEEAKEGIDYLN